MNTATHPVAPEEIMAFVDGELSSQESGTITEHMSHCAECRDLAAELRGTSQALAGWTVAALPGYVESSIESHITASTKNRQRKTFARRPWGGWRVWVSVGGGLIAVLLLIAIPIARPRKKYDQPSLTVSVAREIASKSAGKKYDQPSQPMSARRKSEVSTVQALASREVEDPMVARVVILTVQVKNFAGSRASLDSIVARYNGYAAQLDINTMRNDPPRLHGSLRIPASDLAPALRDIKGLGEVQYESQSGEEVSQQHADLVARLKTSRTTEERFRAILQQRPGNVSDVLEVEEGIARVRGEIEGMEAEQIQLEHRVSFTTIDITLAEASTATHLESPRWTRIQNAFLAGMRNAEDTTIGLLLFVEEYLPSLLIVGFIFGLPILLMRRRYLRLRRKI